MIILQQNIVTFYTTILGFTKLKTPVNISFLDYISVLKSNKDFLNNNLGFINQNFS